MKWYFKVLRHYADFSGRARRKEYWMALLFNIIFALAWTLLLMLICRDSLGLAIMAYQCYNVFVLLPSISVIVRRLHDIGKSGWMLLIVFIPLVGAVWLLTLLLEDSQPGDNQYGRNPKTLPETFDEQTKLKSAGVTLITLFALPMLTSIIYVITNSQSSGLNYFVLRNFAPEKIYELMWVIAGFFLLKGKQIYGVKGKARKAVLLLMVATGMYMLYFFVQNSLWGMNSPFTSHLLLLFAGFADMSFVSFLFNLLIIFFVASILFFREYKKFIRFLSKLVIIFAGCSLWFNVHLLFIGSGSLQAYEGYVLFASILRPMALIVLAGTFFPKKAKKDKPSTAVHPDEGGAMNDDLSKKGILVEPVAFVREDKTDEGTFLTYKALSLADAMTFLSTQNITQPSYYVVVETPEGNYGKDIYGTYKE